MRRRSATAHEPYTHVLEITLSKRFSTFSRVKLNQSPDHELLSKYWVQPLGHSGTLIPLCTASYETSMLRLTMLYSISLCFYEGYNNLFHFFLDLRK